MIRRIVAAALAIGVLLAIFSASPAGAQYAPEGGFTVNPVIIIQGNTALVSGTCTRAAPIQIKLDNTTVVGSGIVPGTNDIPIDLAVTGPVSILITIPPATPIANHTLYVYCHGVLIQILNIKVVGPTCNTTNGTPPPLGGVYGIYGGDPQGAHPAIRPPDPGAAVYGLVTSLSSGLPIPSATIRLLRSDGTQVGIATNTDATGNYAFPTTGLVVNKQYRVKFIELGFVTAQGPLFTYTGSQVLQNFAMTAAAGGPGVSGFVTDGATIQKLQSVQVRLWLLGSVGRYLATATNSLGFYSFVGIPEGDYQLQFAASGYTTYWHLNATQRVNATVITINASPVVANGPIYGTCASNPIKFVDESTGDGDLPLSLSTFGVILLVLGSYGLLANSKRRVIVARGEGGSSTNTGNDGRRNILKRTRRR